MKGLYFKASWGEWYELGAGSLGSSGSASYFPDGETKAQRGRGGPESLDRLVE